MHGTYVGLEGEVDTNLFGKTAILYNFNEKYYSAQFDDRNLIRHMPGGHVIMYGVFQHLFHKECFVLEEKNNE